MNSFKKRTQVMMALGVITLSTMFYNAEASFTLDAPSKLDEQVINVEEVIEKIPKIKDNQITIESIIQQEKLAEEKRLADEKAKLTNVDIAKLVINGDYGNGEERQKNLEADGYDFRIIQDEVLKISDELIAKQEAEATKRNQNTQIANRGSNSSRVKQPAQVNQGSPQGKVMYMQASAYSTAQPELSRYTANGTDLHVNSRVVAVDPNVIPLGTKLTIEGYGTYIAADTGGDIKGSRIDIHFPTVNECFNFGRRNVKVTIH